MYVRDEQCLQIDSHLLPIKNMSLKRNDIRN